MPESRLTEQQNLIKLVAAVNAALIKWHFVRIPSRLSKFLDPRVELMI